MKGFCFPSVLVALFLGNGSHAGSFFHDHTRGWHWYEPENKDQEEQPGQTSRSPTEIINAYRKELEARLHQAWVHPTPQNLRAYQEMQQDFMDRSKLFAMVWMQNVYQHPNLDHTLVSPVNQGARHIHLDLEKEKRRQAIQKLSQTYGLFFFFSGDCPYCHRFAPIVKRFANDYGWEVIAISADGGALEEFPNVQPDNGLFEAWNIKALPTLVAVNPKTQEAIPIAYGLTSLDEMETRIITLLGVRP